LNGLKQTFESLGCDVFRNCSVCHQSACFNYSSSSWIVSVSIVKCLSQSVSHLFLYSLLEMAWMCMMCTSGLL